MSNESQSTSFAPLTVPEGTRHVARVKWFNNKLNFGFATVVHGTHTGQDIFVHQSTLLTHGSNVYRTLRTGEYIEFQLQENPAGSQHKYQALSVTGPHAGVLMCESSPRRPRTATVTKPAPSTARRNNRRAAQPTSQ